MPAKYNVGRVHTSGVGSGANAGNSMSWVDLPPKEQDDIDLITAGLGIKGKRWSHMHWGEYMCWYTRGDYGYSDVTDSETGCLKPFWF